MYAKVGLCVKCQPEVYKATYGQSNISPKLYPQDWKARQKNVDRLYIEQAASAETKLVIVHVEYDEEGDVIEIGLCARHLAEAAFVLKND